MQAALSFSSTRAFKASTKANVARRMPALVAAPVRCQAVPVVAPTSGGDISIRFENGATILSIGGSGAAPAAQNNKEAELQTVAGLFDIWNGALQTGNPEKVAALYAPDGVLLPTVSNRVRTDHAGKVDYFTDFLKLKPFGVIDESHVRFLGDSGDVAAHSGVYTFTLQKEQGPVQVQARFSFIYKKINGEWKITEHHSSAMPEPVADPLAEVAGLFDIWNGALQTGDPEKVAALYAPDGVLLPTVSNRVRTDHAGKVDYFTEFLKLKPFGVIDESIVRFLSPTKDLASNSGVYTFTLQKPEGPVKVQARYSFIYKKVDGEWKITEHHSSAMPEPVNLAEEEPVKTPELVAA